MGAVNVERRLAAIMFTDIVGYTALMAESEEKGLRVRERHRALVRPLVEQYHGESIEARGDESLSVFPTALDAVNCALAIEEQLGDDPELKLHIGIHSGDIVVQGGEVSGDGVNIASRICALSEGGGLCVSGEVYRSIRNQPEIEATTLGERELKNVPEPVAVYAVSGQGAPPRAVSGTGSEPRRLVVPRRIWSVAAVVVIALGIGWWFYRPAGDVAPIRSIAVLPLDNLSGDTSQDYIAAGMHEELISSLVRIGPEVQVTSRTSVMRYQGTQKTIPDIARELDVDYVIEGGALREADRVRISVQLIDARSDAHVWAESYDRDFRSALALQREIALEVANEVQVALAPDRVKMLAAARPVDPDALAIYLRVRHGSSSLGTLWLRAPRGIELLERAVEIDPDFAEAWLLLAALHLVRGITDRTELPKAREAAERVLVLDEGSGGAYVVLSQVAARYDWDFATTRRAMQRAVELSPNDPGVIEHQAFLLLAEGRTEEALAVSQRLLRVAPFDPYYRGQHFRQLCQAREYERALEEVDRTRELFPDFVDFQIMFVHVALGQLEAAHRERRMFFEQCGAPCDALREAAERGWAEGGWEGSVRATLDVPSPFPRDPVIGAGTYLSIGEPEEALALLERGYRERHPNMVALSADYLDSLRDDPRFIAIVRRMGLEE